MQRTTWGLILLFCSIMPSQTCKAKLSVAEVRGYFLSSQPGTAQSTKAFRDDPKAFRAHAKEFLIQTKRVAGDDAAAEKATDQYIGLLDEYIRLIFEGGTIQKPDYIKGIWADATAIDSNRYTAGLLLYLQTGDIEYAVEILALAPGAFDVFANVKDDDMGKILQAVLSRRDIEVAAEEAGKPATPKPYSKFIGVAFPYIARAMYLDDVDAILRRKYLDQMESFRKAMGWRGFVVEDVANAIDGVSPKGLEDLISSLAANDRDEDLAAIYKWKPEQTRQAIRDAIQDRDQSLRKIESKHRELLESLISP